MKVRSYDFVIVYENEPELDEAYVKTMTESRGYPEQLVREYVAQAKIVEERMRLGGKRFEDNMYLVIGSRKAPQL
jgi:hypothetical protein